MRSGGSGAAWRRAGSTDGRPGRRKRAWREVLSGTAAGVLTLVALLQAPGAAAAYEPSADELALLALANEARADAGLQPLVWHDGLGQAARAHSTDMATRDCFQHDSCNGQSWTTRISRYYPLWSSIGEIIALGGDPRGLHEGWMASAQHRSKILGSYSEFGGGLAVSETAFGDWAYATEDFGDRGAIGTNDIPTLPAGGVSPRIGVDETRELFVNYFHAGGGAPKAVRALVGSSCVTLKRTAGSATNGTYGLDLRFTQTGCVPVVFEAIRSDGATVRWPSGKALLVGIGVNGFDCADTTNAVPTQSCGGGGPAPTPTPTPVATPTPTPIGAADWIDTIRVTMRPGKSGGDNGIVSLQAKLPPIDGFDPTSGAVAISILPAQSAGWSTMVPALCGDVPCLAPNDRGTAFRGNLGAVTLSFVQAGDDGWKIRLNARKQALGPVEAGPVDVIVIAGGRVFSGSADGTIKAGRLITN